jgi:hypothetical protein
MSNTYLFVLILLLVPNIFSCEKKEQSLCRKIDDSLVYMRGEKQDGGEALNAFTGFIVAKKNLKATTRYYVLTAKHNLQDRNVGTVFNAIPFLLKESMIFKKGYLENRSLFFSSHDNQFEIIDIKDIGEIDASIISFDSNKNLPIACIKSSKITSDSTEKIEIEGFVKCPNEISDNKYYFKHRKRGEFFGADKFRRKLEKNTDEDTKANLRKMHSDEETIKSLFDKQGINLRYEIPSKTGMSGSPIYNENFQVVALHSKSFLPKIGQEVDKCTVSPQTPYGYGLSMEKILSAHFPDDVRKYMNIQN